MIYNVSQNMCLSLKLSSFLILLAQNNFGVTTGGESSEIGLLRS